MRFEKTSFEKTNFENSIRRQYENFPYPPIPFFALPQRNQGESLKFELGYPLAQNKRASEKVASHQGIRILVAGAGTFEALIIAQAHPYAGEIVAVDLSEASLTTLKRRLQLARIAKFPFKLPPVRLIRADLIEWLTSLGSNEKFDYILASNVLHHTQDPGQLMMALANRLKLDGLMRVVTYPKASRIWMRETSKWLRLGGLNPHHARPNQQLVRQAQQRIQKLPPHHFIRSCFDSQPEKTTATGIIDAFLNACENPYSPLEWRAASQNAGLTWIGETQTESSRSSFLDEIAPELQSYDPWIKLQILDDLLEICANPILWFKKDLDLSRPPRCHSSVQPPLPDLPSPDHYSSLEIPSHVYWEMKQNLIRVQALLQNSTLTLETLFLRLKTQVGPRVDPKNPNRILPGLALSDYDLNRILDTCDPHGSNIELRAKDR